MQETIGNVTDDEDSTDGSTDFPDVDDDEEIDEVDDGGLDIFDNEAN